jgi:hypothetical protein
MARRVPATYRRTRWNRYPGLRLAMAEEEMARRAKSSDCSGVVLMRGQDIIIAA